MFKGEYYWCIKGVSGSIYRRILEDDKQTLTHNDVIVHFFSILTLKTLTYLLQINRPKGFFQFEIITNVLVSSIYFIWIPMLWIYSRRAGPETNSVRTTHHTDKIWLYILLEQTFLIIYRVGVKSDCVFFMSHSSAQGCNDLYAKNYIIVEGILSLKWS